MHQDLVLIRKLIDRAAQVETNLWGPRHPEWMEASYKGVADHGHLFSHTAKFSAERVETASVRLVFDVSINLMSPANALLGTGFLLEFSCDNKICLVDKIILRKERVSLKRERHASSPQESMTKLIRDWERSFGVHSAKQGWELPGRFKTDAQATMEFPSNKDADLALADFIREVVLDKLCDVPLPQGA